MSEWHAKGHRIKISEGVYMVMQNNSGKSLTALEAAEITAKMSAAEEMYQQLKHFDNIVSASENAAVREALDLWMTKARAAIAKAETIYVE